MPKLDQLAAIKTGHWPSSRCLPCLVLENAADTILITNPEGGIVYANQQAVQLLGYSTAELYALSISDVMPPDETTMSQYLRRQIQEHGYLNFETKLEHRDGSVIPVEATAVRLPDGNVYGAYRDVTALKTYEGRLEYLANHDTLTGLANRHLLSDRLKQSIIHARRAGRWVAVAMLDIDRFKLANDSLGHDTGDELLREISQRLEAGVRPGDTVARLGGDKLMVILTDMSSETDVATLAGNLLSIVSLPVNVAGHEVILTSSIGVAIYPRDGDLAAQLYKNADTAMYRAKALGGNCFQFFASEMNARLLERLDLESALRYALERNELELHYQPKVDLRRGYVVGAEALIRWNHPARGLVSPKDFIPVAEETGLIIPIGQWVIDTACSQLKAWHDSGFTDITMAVNVSARQFQQESFASGVTSALSASGVRPPYLKLEVTESWVMVDPEKTTSILSDLKALGIRIGLDDFGTGYSSLNYLKRFPIDCLKIDQSFVRDITSDPDDAAITRMTIELAHGLKQIVIAEGVETEAQLSLLKRFSCDEMQGFLFSPPLSAEEFYALLSSGRQLQCVETQPEKECTLLIVDDETNVISSLKRVLRQDGYRILSTSKPAEALELLAQHPVQVIIADQRMPEMDGTKLMEHVRQIHPDTIRILLTGYTELTSVIDAVNRGAIFKFLTKPWDDDQLRGHIREAFKYYTATSTAASLARC